MSISVLLPLTCPSCGAAIKVPEGAARFTCGYCGNDHLLSAAIQAAAQPKPVLRPRVSRPGSVQILKDEKGACLVQRWFSARYIFMGLFALIWDGFLVFWYSMAIGSGAPLVFILFPALHLAVGVYITYSTLAGFFNRTNVELTRDELAVWFEPLPWPGEKTVKTADIKQLYCKESHSYSRRGGTRTCYALNMVTKDDQDVKLVGGLDSPVTARYFEQQLETWLRIENQPVEGEMEHG
jgi:hypothetical protein